MSTHWIRTPPDRRETATALLAAGIVAASVGVVTFYLTRTLLAREPLRGGELPSRGAGGAGGELGAGAEAEVGGA